jgi:hypothetical protein
MNKENFKKLVKTIINEIQQDQSPIVKPNPTDTKISYSAVILDEDSQEDLKKFANDFKVNGVRLEMLVRNSGWEMVCHHMTLKMGELPENLKKLLFDEKSKRKIPEEERTEQTMEIDAYGYTDKAMAVRVNICSILPTSRTNYMKKTAHITVAINERGGGRAVNSNDIINWKTLDKSIELTGKVDEVSQAPKVK